MLTGRPHDTSVQKAISDNENVDVVLRQYIFYYSYRQQASIH